ncbi:uncharacterized protein I206_101811 [Kwoniella pini CBS 10737]|uniref:Uncharacterized protein n=1 Tax=Kwoniella pini CBS 10737 TaxID=1296096 RepID=A0A1B9HVN2_9TREE|nr:uncharacterized protein I206_06216 [Kwoniella pini CBS 10737]OCF47321.1 hypothetical protein I206_06216 [Kwoniella pini CBS 10737]
MSLIERLTDILSIQISQYAPINLNVPTTPILQISKFIHHVTTTPIHPIYFPYLRFGVLHAIRVTTVWANLTKGKNQNGSESGSGRLVDLFGYLVLAWGGSTVISIILNQPPSWLISTTPWIIYILIYILLILTGLSKYFIKNCPKIIFNLIGSFIDCITRGITITSIGTLISSSSIFLNENENENENEKDLNLWTYCLLSGLAISSGGLIISTLGLNENEWKLNTPNLLKGGFLNTLDFWGSSLIGLLWLILTNQNQNQNSNLNHFSKFLNYYLPDEFKISISEFEGKEKKIIDISHARAICVLVLGFLLATKAIIMTFKNDGLEKKKKRVNKLDKKETLFLDEKKEIPSKVVKTPVKIKEGNNKVTPRKSPRAKSK